MNIWVLVTVVFWASVVTTVAVVWWPAGRRKKRGSVGLPTRRVFPVSRTLIARHYYDETAFRVWPDGTVQNLEDGEDPYSWMSDDWVVVHAYSEELALEKAQNLGYL